MDDNLHRVTVMVTSEDLDNLIRRAEEEGVERNIHGRMPIDKIVIGLIQTYGEGRYTILKR